MSEAPCDRLVLQTDGLKNAFESLLLLDEAFISKDDATNPAVAAAINRAFEEHVPSFNYNEQSNTTEAKFMVDNAMRRLCLQFAEAAISEDCSVMKYCIPGAVRPSIPQLLDLARCLAAIMLADQKLFLDLISEVVETSAIDGAAEVFQYLEGCISHLKAKFTFETPSAPTKLALLRICNMLLRRLSRARHVLLAGRIHIFLAQILPSTDRSAVNANGNVNESHNLEFEDVSEDAVDTEGKPINVEFYKQFWSLQQFFQNPTKAVEPNLWLQVQANIKAVLQQFAKIKPTVASGSINSALADSNQESLTVKYLSSPRLLNLQLRDAGFRRHFLVQSLILLHACTRKSLNKQDTFKIKQQGEADDLQEVLFKELERTPHHGVQFARAVRHLMHHEDQWADWKLDGAASFERPAHALATAEPAPKRRRISKPNDVRMGTRELSRLWNLTADNLSSVQQPFKKPPPTLREFLDPVIREMDPAEAPEDQHKKMKQPVFRWEALRQISKVSRVALASLLRSRDPSLEQAAQSLFPEDIPVGVSKGSGLNLAEASELTGLPALSPGEAGDADSGKDVMKSEEDGELPFRTEEDSPAGKKRRLENGLALGVAENKEDIDRASALDEKQKEASVVKNEGAVRDEGADMLPQGKAKLAVPDQESLPEDEKAGNLRQGSVLGVEQERATLIGQTAASQQVEAGKQEASSPSKADGVYPMDIS